MEITNCGKTKGHPFVMAYLFTPKGVKAYSGSLENIEEATKDLPTCHGVVHYYNKKLVESYANLIAQYPGMGRIFSSRVKLGPHLKRGVVKTDWHLFGAKTFRNAKQETIRGNRFRVNYFSLDLIEPCRDEPGCYRNQIALDAGLKRKKWVLTWVNDKYEHKVIRPFKSLPSQFLRYLA